MRRVAFPSLSDGASCAFAAWSDNRIGCSDGYADRQSAPAIKFATDKSSSISGQCKLTPPPPVSYRSRCSGVASCNSGNQISGTLIIRPSVKETCIISSSNSTDLARAVVGTYARRISGLLLQVLIPSLHQLLLMLLNRPSDLCQFVCSESTV